ncbi:MAG: DUF6514 family protein [Clostridia bacterium]|nr:DUF6514 family protein [Clostridia bacterium]
MINKVLEKKINVVANRDSIYESEISMELEYYLVESEMDKFDELTGKKVYGIEVVKKTDGGITESETVKNFSCCIDSTKSVLAMLADHTVTPVGLAFVLDDILGK